MGRRWVTARRMGIPEEDISNTGNACTPLNVYIYIYLDLDVSNLDIQLRGSTRPRG